MKYDELQRNCNNENIYSGASEILSDINYLNSFQNLTNVAF